MCTAVTYHTKDHYFGRNLDLECHFRESVAVTPRNFRFAFRNGLVLDHHYAMIGMAMVTGGYPLYYDATNEYGLSMAGLYFPENAVYYPENTDKENITPFELIPWLLCQCKNLAEARVLLEKVNLWNQPFSNALPLTPLHWILSDQEGSLVLEPMEDGLHIYENPVGVLANNPPFDYHLHNLVNFMQLSAHPPRNNLAPGLQLDTYCKGLGAMGLPGDLSSPSRFIRAAFTKLNSHSDSTEMGSVTQFFHILGSVAQQDGCVRVGDTYEKTVYASCCNMDKGVYYYTTYENSQITGVDMHREDLDGQSVVAYPLLRRQQIRMEK